MTAADPRLGMPEVIWAHLEHHGDDYDLERSRDIRNLADDLTDLLTAAGYGLVADAKREAWDAAVSQLTYEDGTPVEIAENNNPYRAAEMRQP